MIAYNKVWLDNAALQQEADQAYRQKCITAAEKERISQAYPVGFYTPNTYIRIGLFLLTVAIVLFSLGLFMLLFMGIAKDAWQGLIIFFGLMTYGVLELFVHHNKHYRSGVDEALLWASVALLLTGLNLDMDLPAWLRCLLVFIISLYATLRFADMLMSVVATIALLGCLFYAVILLGELARVTAPFLVMAASIGIYWLAGRWAREEKARHYTHCCTIIKITALITLNLAGNYFVVREASNELFQLDLQPGETIPAGWLFRITTVLIPAVYIYSGIRKKDVVLLRIGLILVAGIIFTIKYYYSMGALEAEMTIGGLLMIGIAYALIRYLQPQKHGFTCKETDNTQLLEKLQVESLIIAETFAPQPAEPPGLKFGGGSGGGGGAEGTW